MISMSAGHLLRRRCDFAVRWLEAIAHHLRRLRLRSEAAQMVRDPYGEPPFPLTREQWEELCRYEEQRQSTNSNVG